MTVMDDSGSHDSFASKQSVRIHPRRKQAFESVSLRHAPRRSKSPQQDTAPQNDQQVLSVSSMDVALPSEAPAKPSWHKNSSGESSNAERWFEKSNNNVRDAQEELRDDEPPFFIQRTSSEESPAEVVRPNSPEKFSTGIRSGKLFDDELDSGSEDFRSVIDDLTIENQRLKRRLKKYERLHSSHLDTEALFEVRVHNGLSAQKKRELEEMLRNFVTKMEQTPVSSTNYSSSKSHGPSSFMPMHTADSGYNSMSMSGQNSSSHSGQQSGARKGQSAPDVKPDLSKDIQSYLSDIPVGLQPHQNGPLSEKEKKKIVVRRLEQLFAGRDPSAGGHQQPIQQEKVAQSAARADRRATQTAEDKHIEGSREARIMKKNGEEAISSKLKQSASENSAFDRTIDEEHVSGSPKLTEQRPTRPLDLDPYRAQIPSENMDYIRHLGFSPPQFLEAQEDGHGWIYLNVLHNMAQLHLSSVTVDFVRKAVTEYSRKLEISSDGRKLRWKGDASITQTSSNTSPDHLDNPPVSKRTFIVEGSDSAHHTSDTSRPGIGSNRHKFAYSPLFARQESNSTSSGRPEAYQMSHGPVVSSAPVNSALLAARAEDVPDAPIVFYKDLNFFLDMTGDASGLSKRKQSSYNRMTGRPLGFSRNKNAAHDLRALDSEKGPLSQLTLDTHTSLRSQSSSSLDVVVESKASSPMSISTPDPLDFEVSGLGGVYPADNFAINVRSRQNRGGPSHDDCANTARRQAYPTLIRHMFTKSHSSSDGSGASVADKGKSSKDHPAVEREIMSSKVRNLPVSRLPEGNYYHDSSDEEDEDMLEYDSDGNSQDGVVPLLPDTQQMDWAPGAQFYHQSESSDSEDTDDDLSTRAADADDRSEESMDLLATARAADPETIRVQEREFDSNMADRLAEDIPAGSSAATAEGGSGFNSPAMVRENSNANAKTMSIAATIGSSPAPTGFGRHDSGATATKHNTRRAGAAKRQRRSDEHEPVSTRPRKSPRRSP